VGYFCIAGEVSLLFRSLAVRKYFLVIQVHLVREPGVPAEARHYALVSGPLTRLR
jgi:hypothetical protein